MYQLHHGDCLEVMATMDDNSVDAIVTDPPYGLSQHKQTDIVKALTCWLNGEEYTHNKKGFMGKSWDSFVPGPEVWKEVYRVLKPGGHALVFAGTRTQDLMSIALRLAGFECRDTIMWTHGSGFPKSANVSKMIDQQEKKRWEDICNAVDEIHIVDIIKIWKEYLKTVNNAGLSFLLTSEKDGVVTHYESIVQKNVLTQESQGQSQKNILTESSNAKYAEKTSRKNQIEIGINTQRNDFAPEFAVLKVDQRNSDVLAIIAELNLIAPHLTSIDMLESIAQGNVEAFTKQQQSHVKFVDKLPQNQIPTHWNTSIVLVNVKELLNEKIKNNLKAVEALKIWLGSKPSLKQAATSALCVALTEDLKHIILSQSKTFLNLDTTRQMDCVSAITVTITEYIAECLILFMANTLKKEAIDKAAGAQREKIMVPTKAGNKPEQAGDIALGATGMTDISTPATPEAQQWNGWGTALKPSFEPVILARKPLDGTVAANVLKYGTGAINVDGCRVGDTVETWPASRSYQRQDPGSESKGTQPTGAAPAGRWPSNVIHDNSEEILRLFPVTKTGDRSGKPGNSSWFTTNGDIGSEFKGDSGSAARYFKACPDDDPEDFEARRLFYCAKASKRDRDEGCEGFEEQKVATMNGYSTPSEGRTADKNGEPKRNTHSTVKPTNLMCYLCRLITPPGGIVLDPFMGSGSTGKAAMLEGFQFIGIERESEYVTIAEARIKAASRTSSNQLPLFQVQEDKAL